MNPLVIFACMVWFVTTVIAFFIGPALFFDSMEREDGKGAIAGIGVFLVSLLSASFFISMIAS